MKYKVICNDVVMSEGCTALKALTLVCGLLQGQLPTPEQYHVRVFYQNKAGEWKLETTFNILASRP